MNVFTSAADAVDSIIAGNVQPTDVSFAEDCKSCTRGESISHEN